MGVIVYLTAGSMNDALGAAGRAHRSLFENLGHDHVEVNLASPRAQELLDATIHGQPIEFSYGAVGFGADLRGRTADGRDVNLWEANQIPFISLNGDSPAYFFDRHVMPSPWHACLYCYPEHLELRQRLKPTRGIYGTVPPFPRDLTDRLDVDFRKKEQGTLLFLKNGNDPEKLVEAWRQAMPAEAFVALAGLASELANSVATELGCDIDAMVTSYFRSKGWDITECVNLRLFFIAQLDDYLRRIKSTMLAEILADFPVEIRGLNWEHVNFSGRRARYIRGGDYTKSRQEIVESLGIVDMSPNTQRLPHERPLRAFGLYTLCLTNEQAYFTDNFDESAAFSYRFIKEELREKFADVLGHPRRYVELGVAVAEQFRQRYKPEDFAQFMLDTANYVRLTCRGRTPGLQDFFIWPSVKIQ